MIVRWTHGALADLRSIENYQRLHFPAARAAFEARLTEIERRIVAFPLSGPTVEQRHGVRMVDFHRFRYRLFYRVGANEIDVLAIRHTSRRSLFD